MRATTGKDVPGLLLDHIHATGSGKELLLVWRPDRAEAKVRDNHPLAAALRNAPREILENLPETKIFLPKNIPFTVVSCGPRPSGPIFNKQGRGGRLGPDEAKRSCVLCPSAVFLRTIIPCPPKRSGSAVASDTFSA